jgi:periplasmic copper chaperone A
MTALSRSFVIALALCGAQSLAFAHVEISSGRAQASTTQDVVFDVGHGCGGADTYSISIDVPAGVTGVRPSFSAFGPAVVTKNGAGTVTNITWTRPGDTTAGDLHNYKFTLRLKTPDAPFTTLYFPVHQVCKVPGNAPMPPVEWTDTPATTDAGVSGHPAAALVIVPQRAPGWNKYTLAVDVPAASMSVYLKDALIVWNGTAAFSANTGTMAQIGMTGGVTALTSLTSGDVISVKY